FDARVEAGAALNNGSRRLRLPADVEHEQNRPAECRRDIGGRAGAARLSRHAVEKPHQAFAEDQLTSFASSDAQLAKLRRGHRPTVEIKTLFAGRRRVESGVDIIRPAFGTCNGEARIPESAHE